MRGMVEVLGYSFPDELRYTEEHIWVRESDNILTLGFDDLASKLIGNILFITLADEGTELKPRTVFGTMESMKWVERLKSPVSGTVVEVNRKLENFPILVNKEPYGNGWFIKIIAEASTKEELSKLVGGQELQKWATKEIERRQKETQKTSLGIRS